jgi:diguanylate cyclase (GGDEF)-like protein/PAS domain S-box-containing protein
VQERHAAAPGPGAPHARPDVPAGLYEHVVAGATDAVVGIDLEGRVLLWNPAAERLLGWSADEVLGRHVSLIQPDGVEDEIRDVEVGLSGPPRQAAVETVRRHRSGELIPVSLTLSALHDEKGSRYGSCAVVRDNRREMALRRQLELAQQQAEARFTDSLVPQATLSPDGVIDAVNAAMCRMLGYTEKQLLGQRVSDLVADGEREESVRRIADLRDGTLSRISYQRRVRHAAGHEITTQISTFPSLDDEGRVDRLEVVMEDISGRLSVERELQEREARWQALVLHSSDVAFLTDADARMLFVSSSVLQQFGYHPDQLVGQVGFGFWHPEDEPSVRAIWAEAVSRPGCTLSFEGRVRHLDGSWRWVEETATNSLEVPGIEAMVVNLTDITERKRAEVVLQELAGQDTLTGLATRAPLMAALDAVFASGTEDRTAVVVLDLERFKLVNDAHGHRVADEVLAAVASRLLGACDSGSVVARLGGDQFAVVVSDVSDPEQLTARVEALRAAVAQPLQVGSTTVTVTANAGAATGPAGDASALLAAAEGALHDAKRRADGHVQVCAGQSESAAVARARLVEDLRRGIAADELVVHYQPVLSLSDGRLTAVEALVRWQHPERGLLAPDAFIGAAEDSGLIVALGEKVLLDACRTAALWAPRAADGHPFHVAVNLSARQLTSPDVIGLVRRCLAATGAAARHLMLEVTESAVMADVEATGHTLRQLRSLGLSIAVDDFGTGYSSLTYLKRFPVTTLKIDRSFVSGLGRDEDDAAIVSSVLSLARAIGLDCIAEGIESDDQRAVLEAMGCAHGQGFLWSPALPSDALEAWWRDYTPEAACASPPGRRDAAPEPDPPEEEQAAVSALVARLHREGASLHTITAALNAEQLTTPQGRRWSTRAVARLIAVQHLT